MHEIATKYPRAAAIIGAVILFFVIGMAVTTIAANYHNTAETAPEPTTTATETVTETKTVERLPKACKTALKLSDDLDEAHDKLHRASPHVAAYSASGQDAELTEAVRTAERLADDIDTIRTDYRAAQAACEG